MSFRSMQAESVYQYLSITQVTRPSSLCLISESESESNGFTVTHCPRSADGRADGNLALRPDCFVNNSSFRYEVMADAN